MKNKKGFTLVELLLALVIAGTLLGMVMTMYTSIKGADIRMSNKRLLLGEASDLIDRIHEAALDYTIDYEEYFNRSGLNLGIGNTGFSSYGNSGNRYYCVSGIDSGKINTWNADKGNNQYYIYNWDNNNGGCFSGGNQKYGEYGFQHRKLQDYENLNSSGNANSNMKVGPIAISPNTGLDYLYLINPDGTERYYFRRILKKDKGDGKNEKLYVVQMLRLRGFDVGTGRNCSTRGAYDGFIDTWACDLSQGYSCTGLMITGCNADNVNGYRLPSNANDGWVDITSDKVTVSDMKIDIYPNKDPYLVGNETGLVYDPYAKISFTMNLYNKASSDEITLTTTLSFKNSYSRFPIEKYPGYIPNDAY